MHRWPVTWVLRVLDSRLLSRIREAFFLGTAGLAAVLFAAAVLLALVKRVTHVGVVSLVFIGLGLLVLLAGIVGRLLRLWTNRHTERLRADRGISQTALEATEPEDSKELLNAALTVHTNADSYRRRVHDAIKARIYWSLPMPGGVFNEHANVLRQRPDVYRAVAAAYIWFDELNNAPETVLGAPMSEEQAAKLETGWPAAQHAVDTLDALIDELSASNASVGATKLPCVSHGDVEVCLERVEWERFDYRALILMARLRIDNRGEAVFRARGFQIRFDSPGGNAMADIEVHRRVAALQRTHPLASGVVEPHDYVTGWVVSALPHRLQGRPSFDLVVEDDMGNQLALHMAEQQPAQYVSDEAAKRRVLLPPGDSS